MRCSCGFFSLPRQYAPATRGSAQPLPIRRVLGRCGPRQRSFHTVSPSRFDVVVDGQLAGADLDRGALGGLRLPELVEGPFSPMSSSLNGSSASSARASSSVTTRRTNRWPSRMMRSISFSIALSFSGVNGCCDAEVVVEAVGDRRADAEVRLRVDALDGLREHVRGRVAQDAETVRAVDRHRLDGIRLLRPSSRGLSARRSRGGRRRSGRGTGRSRRPGRTRPTEGRRQSREVSRVWFGQSLLSFGRVPRPARSGLERSRAEGRGDGRARIPAKYHWRSLPSRCRTDSRDGAHRANMLKRRASRGWGHARSRHRARHPSRGSI